MPTLVNRVREVISADSDDFFNDDTILYYLNKSQERVLSYLLRQETLLKGSVKSLRALDDFRVINSTTLSGDDFTLTDNTYYVGDLDFPSDLNQFDYLRYNTTTPLKELGSRGLFLIEWGNLSPTTFESYFHVLSVSDEESPPSVGKVFRLYLPEDPDGNDVTIFYIKTPTEIESDDESLTELPSQLENAVIYGAAFMMINQESVKDEDQNSDLSIIGQFYKEELKINTY